MNQYETSLFKDKQLGFAIYLGVEAVMFLTLFSTYFIFTPSPHGPQPDKLFDALTLGLSSFFLITSSGTLIVAEKGLNKGRKKLFLWGLGTTALFALVFLGLEVREFYSYLSDGYGMHANHFMASFYVLVGLHAAHVAFGIGWMIMLFVGWLRRMPFGLQQEKLRIFSYYWHFVDAVWILIICIVYLPGLL